MKDTAVLEVTVDPINAGGPPAWLVEELEEVVEEISVEGKEPEKGGEIEGVKDAGGPAPFLIEDVEESLLEEVPVSGEKEGEGEAKEGGTPPEWLVEAIEESGPGEEDES